MSSEERQAGSSSVEEQPDNGGPAAVAPEIDIEALAEQCKFCDCSHASEPGCAVREAIENGKLDPQRFASYLKLSGEVSGAASKLANRRAQKADIKAPGKPAGKRSDDKHGRR